MNPRAICYVCVAVWFHIGSTGWCGGGPENVFVVVNSADQNSLSIANHFVHVREIPQGNVFYVSWPDAAFHTDLATFRERLLQPTLDAIGIRKLRPQIDYIVYSSGFPYAVKFGDAKNTKNLASLTGLTYLYQAALATDNAFASSASNAYARNLLGEGESSAFRAQYGIDLLGRRVAASAGNRYYLSMMLGYTSGQRNNTLPEIFRYLDNAVAADATQPPGTIYFVRNNNIRSKVRDSEFDSIAQELQSLGVGAEVIDGGNNERDVLPVKKPDVQGAMVGFYRLDWRVTGSKILPGAICENFTSYGGVLSGKQKQTLLSQFLRFGAVASSGTVVEPYAIAAKFPHPRMHVHYARGCSVAEAYYQSVLSPYQLLIVGDPLCQPWSRPPQLVIKNVNTRKKLSGVIRPKIEITSTSGNSIRNVNIYIDGRLYQQLLPKDPCIIDTRRLMNGYHELRVVAVEDTPIETQGRSSVAFVCLNSKQERTFAVSARVGEPPPGGVFLPRQVCPVRVRSSAAREIRLYRGRELLGRVEGESGVISLNTEQLGSGIISVQPIAIPAETSEKPVAGFPVEIRVAQPGGLAPTAG